LSGRRQGSGAGVTLPQEHSKKKSFSDLPLFLWSADYGDCCPSVRADRPSDGPLVLYHQAIVPSTKSLLIKSSLGLFRPVLLLM